MLKPARWGFFFFLSFLHFILSIPILTFPGSQIRTNPHHNHAIYITLFQTFLKRLGPITLTLTLQLCLTLQTGRNWARPFSKRLQCLSQTRAWR